MENKTHRDKVYISGKITGLPDCNRPKFLAAEALIIKKGLIPVNPHKLDDEHNKSWVAYMKACIAALIWCDAVFVLDDWNKSRGAIREIFIALFLQIPVYEIETMNEVKLSFWIKIKLLLNII